MEKDKEQPKLSCNNSEKINNVENNLDSYKQVESDNNFNTTPEKEKPGYNKDVALCEERRIINLRPRNRIERAPSTMSGREASGVNVTPISEIGRKRNLIKTQLDVPKKEPNNSFGSVGLTKVNYNVTLDPNIVDRYTNVPVSSLPGAISPPLESPETKRKRLDSERLKIAKQCRLHPSNKKYNQGPVVNPPLISPGVVVGYTPAGQRHQVDLNFERPTWFNSEYARMQFDDATRINASRMFNELEHGRFLPSSLNPDVERKHFAERERASKEAREYFESCLGEQMELSDGSDEYMSLLETEQQLIDLNEFAVVKIQDFSEELAKRLNNALTLNITPLMFTKNPIILETIEQLSNQREYSNVIKPAQALLNKIKSLFDVPLSQTFQQYFASEVDRLRENTKHMSSFDIFMLTEEPANKSIVELSVSTSSPVVQSSETNANTVEMPETQNEPEEEWIPVENGDHWVDINETNEMDSIDGHNQQQHNNNQPTTPAIQSPSTVTLGGSYTGDDEQSDTEESDDGSEEYSDEELESDFEEYSGESGDSEDEEDPLTELVHGMLLLGYPCYTVLHYFEFI